MCTHEAPAQTRHFYPQNVHGCRFAASKILKQPVAILEIDMSSFKIDGYALRQWSSRATTNLNPGTAVAGIYLYEGNKYRGYVYFFPDGTPLAPAVEDSANGRVFLHFNLSQFHSTMDILRKEDPIYVYYTSPTHAALRSGKEPVGEEE